MGREVQFMEEACAELEEEIKILTKKAAICKARREKQQQETRVTVEEAMREEGRRRDEAAQERFVRDHIYATLRVEGKMSSEEAAAMAAEMPQQVITSADVPLLEAQELEGQFDDDDAKEEEEVSEDDDFDVPAAADFDDSADTDEEYEAMVELKGQYDAMMKARQEEEDEYDLVEGSDEGDGVDVTKMLETLRMMQGQMGQLQGQVQAQGQAQGTTRPAEAATDAHRPLAAAAEAAASKAAAAAASRVTFGPRPGMLEKTPVRTGAFQGPASVGAGNGRWTAPPAAIAEAIEEAAAPPTQPQPQPEPVPDFEQEQEEQEAEEEQEEAEEQEPAQGIGATGGFAPQSAAMRTGRALLLRYILASYFAKHAPEQLERVEELVARVVGGKGAGGALWTEAELFDQLEAKYGAPVELDPHHSFLA